MNTPPPFPRSPQPQRCGLATWSLGLGIAAILLTIVLIGPFIAIPAVICGHVALGRIKRAGGALSGHGAAMGGLIMGYVGLALMPVVVIGMLSAIAIPNFVRARKTAQMNACINNLRLIDAAKQQWALENSQQTNTVPAPAQITPYVGRQQLMPVCPAGGSYQINAVSEVPTCTVRDHALTE